MASNKKRLDIALLERGLVESRSKAQALILAKNVMVNGETIDKSHFMVDENATIEIKKKIEYVSRGAYKLIKALDHFGISVKDKVALDIGASTGGFTDVLLQRGAKKVYAVDSGINQLDYRLRIDPRVVVMEKTNARYLSSQNFMEKIELTTIDVSFISLKLILPVVANLNCQETIALIKPQFEVGKEIRHFDGVVRKQEEREKAIEKVKNYASENGFHVIGVVESPLEGPKGNVEYLIYLVH